MQNHIKFNGKTYTFLTLSDKNIAKLTQEEQVVYYRQLVSWIQSDPDDEDLHRWYRDAEENYKAREDAITLMHNRSLTKGQKQTIYEWWTRTDKTPTYKLFDAIIDRFHELHD